jgi:hypothetical protein
VDQLEFDFDAPNADVSGYENWRNENKARLKRIAAEWCVPLDSTVRLRLKNMEGEYTGYLILLEHPPKISRKRCGALRLRLNLDNKDFVLGKRDSIEFTSDDIEAWHKA